MGHPGAAPEAARAVSGGPDDLTQEGGASEDAVAEELGLVHGAVVEVEPHRAVLGEALAHRGDARAEPSEVGVEGGPAVLVRHAARDARASVPAPRAEASADAEWRIEVDELGGPGGDVAAEVDGVAANEQAVYRAHGAGDGLDDGCPIDTPSVVFGAGGGRSIG